MSFRSSDSSASSEAAENSYCVFMHIVEGVGLQRARLRSADGKRNNREQILLHVSLNNVKFEIEGHSTETVTIFNSNCIWECGLGDIRRMKTDHRPVRIDCFLNAGMAKTTPLKLIGTLLLPIRGLPTLSSLRNYEPKFLWHKLGSLCADCRPFKPEIYLLLVIAKKSVIEAEHFEQLLGKKQTPAKSSPHASETSSMLQSQSNVYVQLLEQVGLIQVGNNPDVDCDIYQVILTLRRVKDLATLLEIDNCQAEKNCFIFAYELLGNSSHVEITIDHSDSYTLNDKMALKFKTSIKSLRLYFQRIFYVPINIFFNGHAIATYRFDCSKFLPHDDYFDSNHFWDKNGSFYFDHLHKILSPRAKKPTVEFNFSMQLTEAHFRKSSKEAAIFDSHFSANAVKLHDDRGAGGDSMSGLRIAASARQQQQQQQLKQSISRTNSDPALKYNKLKGNFLNPAASASRDVAIDTKDFPANSHVDACSGSDDLLRKSSIGINTETVSVAESNDEPPSPPPKPLNTSNVEIDAVTLKAVEELEAWKAQQMDEFLVKLDRKEQLYLQMLEKNSKKQQNSLQDILNAKNNECMQLKTQLEASQMALHAVKTDDNTLKIQQLERDIKRLETELRQQHRKTAAKQLDVDEKHQDEKQKLLHENFVLKKNIAQLEQKIMSIGKTHFPAEELKEMITDLREQTAHFAEVEKLKNFFEEKYTQVSRELKKMKFNNLKQKEKRIQSRLKKDDFSSEGDSNDESEAAVSQKSSSKIKTKTSFREMLLKQCETSDTGDIDEA